jgi:hypothetical protein
VGLLVHLTIWNIQMRLGNLYKELSYSATDKFNELHFEDILQQPVSHLALYSVSDNQTLSHPLSQAVLHGRWTFLA